MLCSPNSILVGEVVDWLLSYLESWMRLQAVLGGVVGSVADRQVAKWREWGPTWSAGLGSM